MTDAISDDIAREHESVFKSDSVTVEREQSSVVTPSKLNELLDGFLKQCIANGWVSDEMSDFDFDMKYDPVKCVITHRMPLFVRMYPVPDGTSDDGELVTERD